MSVRGYSLISGICLFAVYVAVCSAYPSQTVPFAKLAEAPVIATCIVQETSQDSSPAGPAKGIVSAHATLLVLRSFPELAIRAGERIHLDYEAHPALDAQGYQWMGGPDVPPLTPNAIFVLPLKLNRKP